MQYAFSQFIVNCALVDLDTWEFIEAHTELDSCLRRFSSHWIAWNVSLGQTEYASLQAASLAGQVSDSTRDPRTYQIEHWQLSCADDLGVACDHNVGAKISTNERVATTYSEIGRDWELTHGNQSSTSNTNRPPPKPPSAPQPYRPYTWQPYYAPRRPCPPPTSLRSSSPSPSPGVSDALEALRFRHVLLVCISQSQCVPRSS